MKYKVLGLDTDFHNIITIGEGLSLEEAEAIKHKYSRGAMIEPELNNKIKENALYKYAKGCSHAKHGIVYTKCDDKGKMWAIDTYWDSEFKKGLSQDTRYYAVEDIADDIEFSMMIEDIVEVSKNEFYLYDSEDTLYIPVGGWHERYLVKRNAIKNVTTVIESLEYKIDQIKREIKSLGRDVEKLSDWLFYVKADSSVAQSYKDEKYEFDVVTAKGRIAIKQ